VDIADYATKINQAYADAGLTVCSYPTIYITENDNQYTTLTGNVLLGVDVVYDNNPEKTMAVHVAHELFHTAQCKTIGFADYSASYYKDVAFWIDASADYMAITRVWELMNEASASNYDYYDLEFFQESLYTADGGHEYQAARFVKFVQDYNKATPIQLVTLAESYSAFPDAFSALYCDGVYPDLKSYYMAFLVYSLFDSSSGFDYENNAEMAKAIKNGTTMDFELDEDGNGQPASPPIEGDAALNFPGEYTAEFYTFSTNCDTALTITPSADVKLYKVDRTRSDRGYESCVDAAAGVSTEMSFGKD
jgi:hypothetical protein